MKPAQIIRELGPLATLWDSVREQLGTNEKTALWFTTDNPMLGNIAPLTMVRQGRGSKLERFVNTSLAENHI